MPVSDAFKAVMQANLDRLQADERGVLTGRNPEYLHQMRVALRRLRAALSVFAPLFPRRAVASARGELKWLARRLGPARDWDVFATETLPSMRKALGLHETFETFAARCEKLRRVARGRALRALRSARYRHLVTGLGAWLASAEWLKSMNLAARAALQAPLIGYAAAVLERRYGRVRKKGRGLTGLPACDLHRLRIAIKKYRYAVDFFAELYDAKAVRDALKRLSRLQDILGSMNDAVTAEELVKRCFGGVRERRVLRLRGRLLGWNRRRTAALRRELKDAWKAFHATEKFW